MAHAPPLEEQQDHEGSDQHSSGGGAEAAHSTHWYPHFKVPLKEAKVK